MKKNILISGGAGGLGKAMAAALTPEHRVIILDQDAKAATRAAQTLSCDYVVADITSYDDIAKALAVVRKKYRQLDCLINNAGIWLGGNLINNNPADIARVMAINATGTMLLTRAALPLIKPGGIILTTISQNGLTAKPERSVYTASKWALTGFTKCLQRELHPQGIRVTGLYPGLMNTELFAKAGNTTRGKTASLDPNLVAQWVKMIINAPPTVVIPELGIYDTAYIPPEV